MPNTKILFAMVGSAEENIGTIVFEDPTKYVIEDPRTFYKYQSNGGVDAFIAPFCMTINDPIKKVNVLKSNIAWYVLEPDISQDVLTNYKNELSGLVVPKGTSKKLIV